MKKFLFDVILDRENICNLTEDAQMLIRGAERGDHIIFYGRRNTGKTSLIKSIVIPEYKKLYKNSLILFVDFMGVKTTQHVSQRLRISYEQSISALQPTKQFLVNLGKTFKNFRPTIGIDPITSSPTFSLGVSQENKEPSIAELFRHIGKYHLENNSLIIMDEFQDIVMVDEAEGLFRDAMQNLPGNLSIIILGSKKHLLGKIFASGKSPLAGWGKYHEISLITAEDFHEYMKGRLTPLGFQIDLETTKHILKLSQNIPEPINIICENLTRTVKPGNVITNKLVDLSLSKVLEERHGLFEEYLARFTEKELRFLVALSKNEPVAQPNSKNFLKQVNLSPGGNRPILMRLENEAIIYKTEAGYVLADPLLSYFLKIYR